MFIDEIKFTLLSPRIRRIGMISTLTLLVSQNVRGQPFTPRRALKLERRLSIERTKRMGLARRQLHEANRLQDPKLWVKGRRNRALASQVKVKSMRIQAQSALNQARTFSATDSKAQTLREKARRLFNRANRLSRAVKGYALNTKMGWDAYQFNKKPRAEGSPLQRLWQYPTAPEEYLKIRDLKGSLSILAKERMTLEGMTGSKPLTPHEVIGWLNQLPGTGRKHIDFMEEGYKNSPFVWRIVRTGYGKNGQPKGYVISAWTNPDTGEKTVQFHGTHSSWVRKSVGSTSSTAVLSHRPQKGKDGTVFLPAGTMSVVTEEMFPQAYRTSQSTHYINQNAKTKTLVQRADGSSEDYQGMRYNDGTMIESRTRVKPDGNWQSVQKVFDGQALTLSKANSRGKVSERILPQKTLEKLISRYQQSSHQSEKLTAFKGNLWRYTKTSPTLAHEQAVISAYFKKGFLGGQSLRWISPLGTEHGKVEEKIRPFYVKAREFLGKRSIKPKTHNAGNQPANGLPEGTPSIPRVTKKDRQAVEFTETLVNLVRQKPLKLLIDPSAESGFANARPTDNTVFSRVGPRGAYLQAELNDDVARFGPTAATSPIPLQLGTAFHEAGHEKQEKMIAANQWLYAAPYHFGAIGRSGLADAYGLRFFDFRRTTERLADKNNQKAVQVRQLLESLAKAIGTQGRAFGNRHRGIKQSFQAQQPMRQMALSLEQQSRHITGMSLSQLAKKITPQGLASDFYQLLKKGQGNAFHPFSPYDPLEYRVETIKNAFNKALKAR